VKRRSYPLFALALALSACGGSDDETTLGSPPRHRVPGCEQFDVAPCDVETPACQTRLLGLAACLRGSDNTELPPITVISEDEFANYLEEQYRALGTTDHLAEWQSALSMLSLVAPDGLEMDTRVAESVKNVWGFYSEEDKSVRIIDHGADSNRETSTSVLVHEFVHVLQDREVDLAAVKQGADTYDQGLAVDAVIEGEAQFQQERFLASMLGFDPAQIDWDRLFENGVDDGEQALFQQDSVMTAAWDIFPYRWGARRVHLGWDATGHAGVLDLFASPPADTQVLMASIDAVATDVEPVQIDAPVPTDDWAPLGDDVLGAFGTFELLGKRTSVDTARELAVAWRGDRLAIYGGAGDQHVAQTAVVWQCEFADAASATKAQQRLRGGAGTVQLAPGGTRVTLARASDASSLPWAVGASTP